MVEKSNDASVVIWTTTPWTIPANQAVSFSESISYGLFEVEDVMTEEELGFAPYALPGDKLVIAEALAEAVMSGAKVKKYKSIGAVPSTVLDNMRLNHPLAELGEFFQHEIPMLPGDHVTADAGTGFVHTAPAHGEDDYNVWIASGRSLSLIHI